MKKILFVAAAMALLGFGVNAAEAQKETLKDGTNIEIVDGSVSIINKDGSKTVAPDGTHELANGDKVITKEGKIQAEQAN